MMARKRHKKKRKKITIIPLGPECVTLFTRKAGIMNDKRLKRKKSLTTKQKIAKILGEY